MQSVKYLLDFLFKEINSNDYYKLIMMDMHELMSSNFNSALINFFEESREEKKSVDRNSFCNMMIPFFDTDIE